jgi:23S rRNA (adenine2503-C2)-methyltransferase
LPASVPWDALSVIKEQTAQDTEKILAACADDLRIETVLMRHGDDRRTVCVSSQVGCPMACGFCATGQLGLKRNLTRDEIAEQVVLFARKLKAEQQRVTNVVVMGMGEPLNNYDAVLGALHLLNDPEAFGLGARHFSLSTCGIVPGILRLAEEPLQLNLAISLHAAHDELRSRLMPANRTYPLVVLMRAVREYMAKTNRRVMFEYLMLRGVNDSEQDARALAELLGPDFRLVQVNLLTYHPTQTFTASDRIQVDAFLRTLHELGVPATHRKTFGEEIDAACGQLAAQEP